MIKYVFWCTVLFLVGCERPFVESEAPVLQVVSPSLDTVQLRNRVLVVVRADSPRPVESVQLRGQPMNFDERTQLWSDTLRLNIGVNEFIVSATNIDGSQRSDTLRAFYMDFAFNPAPFTLPAPRGGHTTTRLDDGTLFVAGGTQSDVAEAEPTSFILVENDPTIIVEGAMRPRTGHTATILPDGRVLLLGGSRLETPGSITDFVEIAQVFDPESQTFQDIPMDGDPIRRAHHNMSAFSLDVGVESFFLIYLYGGTGDIRYGTNPALGIRRDIRALFFRNDSLINNSPTMGFFLTASSGSSQTLIQNTLPSGFARYLVAGTEFVNADLTDGVFFELHYSQQFGIREQGAGSFRVPRTRHAAARIGNGLVGFFGGRTFSPDGAMNSSEVYVALTRDFLRLPDARVMEKKRWGHTATNWSDGRILLLGGFDASGQAHSDSEWFDVVVGQ